MRLDVFDRWDKFLFSLGENDLIECEHTDELSGDDTLRISTDKRLTKGYRIVWLDSRGTVHEHIVDSSEPYDHEAETYTCLNSMAELFGKTIEDLAGNDTVKNCITQVLSGTRWTAGTVNVEGATEQKELHFCYTTAREALADIIEAFGGEVQADIAVSGDKITSRKISLLEARGQDNGRRFTYARDLEGVERIVESDDVITRLYGYGKSDRLDDDEHEVRVDFKSVNGGKAYVEDATAMQEWGLPTSTGAKTHFEGVITFDEIEDKAELLKLTRQALAQVSAPKVSYEAKVIDTDDVFVGDVIQIIDKDRMPEIRVQGRITKAERDLLTGQATVTIGNIASSASGLMGESASSMSSLRSSGGFSSDSQLGVGSLTLQGEDVSLKATGSGVRVTGSDGNIAAALTTSDGRAMLVSGSMAGVLGDWIVSRSSSSTEQASGSSITWEVISYASGKIEATCRVTNPGTGTYTLTLPGELGTTEYANATGATITSVSAGTMIIQPTNGLVFVLVRGEKASN